MVNLNIVVIDTLDKAGSIIPAGLIKIELKRQTLISYMICKT